MTNSTCFGVSLTGYPASPNNGCERTRSVSVNNDVTAVGTTVHSTLEFRCRGRGGTRRLNSSGTGNNNNNNTCVALPGQCLVHGDKSHSSFSQLLLVSNVSLSFWGGIDPLTGIIIDTSHPLHGQCVADTIFCIPSGRGSCTASQVLLELILNAKAPRALILRDVDGLACVGAVVAQEVFLPGTTPNSDDTSSSGTANGGSIYIPDICHIGTASFDRLWRLSQAGNVRFGRILRNGQVLVGKTKESIDDHIENDNSNNIINNTNNKLDDIHFTENEEQMLQACTSDAERMACRVMFRYAHIVNSSPNNNNNNNNNNNVPPLYLDISQAHIDGCTYIGPGGLEFVQRLVQAGGRVRVPTTLNSVSADRRQHAHLGVPADYAQNSLDLGDAYLALHCQPSFTCAPYLLTNPPNYGDDIAWGESNAVVFANSVLGARTEKYADYLDICCALTAKVPAVGVHLESQRRPQVVLDATGMLQELMDQLQQSNDTNMNLEMLFPTLGHLCGSLSDGKVPIVLGFDKGPWTNLVTRDHLKAFCAAFGTTGTSPLVHIAGITPEALRNPDIMAHAATLLPQKKIITWKQVEETFSLLDNQQQQQQQQQATNGGKVDLIALGNPHLSIQECHALAAMIEALPVSGRNKDPNVRIMACLSREIQSQASALDEQWMATVTEFGVELINDTCWCMLLDPPVIPAHSSATIMTNSGKYAHYGPGLTSRRFRYGSMRDCLQAAVTGKYPVYSQQSVSASSTSKFPPWLLTKPELQTEMQRRNYASSANYAMSKHYAATEASWSGPAATMLRQNRHTVTSSTSRSLASHAMPMLRMFAKR